MSDHDDFMLRHRADELGLERARPARPDEVERIERIDRLADWMLDRPGEERPAIEVWDEAAKIIDGRIAREAGDDRA
jgi:hypothetical protein